MANLNNPDGSHEQQRPEDYWTEVLQRLINPRNNHFNQCSAFDFGRNYVKFKDKSGKTITVKITSK